MALRCCGPKSLTPEFDRVSNLDVVLTRIDILCFPDLKFDCLTFDPSGLVPSGVDFVSGVLATGDCFRVQSENRRLAGNAVKDRSRNNCLFYTPHPALSPSQGRGGCGQLFFERS